MPTSTKSTIGHESILKIEIDNSWSASDFASIFDSTNRLYGYHMLLDNSLKSLNFRKGQYNLDSDFKRFPEFSAISHKFKRTAMTVLQGSLQDYLYLPIHVSFPIRVNKVKFGSKGSIDLLGIGEIFRVIKDLIINYVPNQEQKLDNLTKELEIEEKEQVVLQMKIENLRKLGLSSHKIFTLIGFGSDHLNKLDELVKRKSITDIKVEDYLTGDNDILLLLSICNKVMKLLTVNYYINNNNFTR